ncbi:MAG: hypothetical protein IPQ16_13785 [Geobacteraceae bacterium]|nr:hypothetical protein [Geobacteraceae bacterium]
MERTIPRIILDAFFACILVAGVYLVWVLRGRSGSFKSEFNETNKRRNGMVFLILLTAVVAAVIYVNNR